MFLKKLTVRSGDREVRSVAFRKGLNLIVDATPDEARASGNNIGKTTALRCIDYCLDGDPKALYLDREWRSPNKEVFEFLEKQQPTFVLELIDTAGKIHTIERRYGETERLIDGELLSSAEATRTLRTLLFRVEGNKPTLRQLAGKFIRLSLEAKHNTLRWLHPTTPSADYDVLWLTLFGFTKTTLLNERRRLQKELKSLAARKKEIEALAKSPRQARSLLEKELERAQKQLNEFAIAEAQERDLEKLAAVRQDVIELSERLAVAEGHIQNGKRTLALLEKAGPRVSSETIREVFEDAKRFNEDLHAEYDSMLSFHDAMLKNKATFTQRRLHQWENAAKGTRMELRQASEKEATLLRSLSSPDALEDVRRLNAEVVRLSGELGFLRGLESELSRVGTETKTKQSRIGEIQRLIDDEKETLAQNLEQFNEHFSDYSRQLYGSGYYLDLPWEEGTSASQKIVPTIDMLEGHAGSGKKRQEIAAFDLAYLKWQEDRGAKTVRFTLHDEAELIYKNQLATLFQITQALDGQVVLPVLSDKLATIEFEEIQDCVVLELSESDKFFRLP